METILLNIQTVFQYIVHLAILLLEAIGVSVLVYTAIHSLIGLFQRSRHVKLQLAEGIGLALEFKLGSEVLRTLIVREWNELAILGAIVLLRAAITFLIQWEIRHERQSLDSGVV